MPPQCFGDSRDAKYNAAGAMHRVVWALQKAKAIGQKCEKP